MNAQAVRAHADFLSIASCDTSVNGETYGLRRSDSKILVNGPGLLARDERPVRFVGAINKCLGDTANKNVKILG